MHGFGAGSKQLDEGGDSVAGCGNVDLVSWVLTDEMSNDSRRLTLRVLTVRTQHLDEAGDNSSIKEGRAAGCVNGSEITQKNQHIQADAAG